MNRLGIFLRTHKVLLLVTSLVAMLLYGVSQFGVITVTTNGSAGGAVTFQIAGQSSGSLSEESTEGSITKIVKKGAYQVTARGEGGSGLAVIEARGFFQRSSNQISIAPENERIFVGDNPGACMVYGKILFSYACMGSTKTSAVHIAATSKEPSYVTKNPFGVDGLIEGVFQSPQGTIALVRQNLDEQYKKHVFFIMDENYRPISKRDASFLDASKIYTITTYGDGVLFHDQDISELFFTDQSGNNPRRTEVAKPSSNTLRASTLTVNDDGIVAILFTNRLADADEGRLKDIRNEIITMDGTNTNHYPLNNKTLGQMDFCGSLLCVMSGSSLELYDVTPEKLSYQYQVSGVQGVITDSDSSLLVTDTGVLNFDPDTRSGVYDYTFGAYAYCGIRPLANTSYLLCVKNTSGKTTALLINPAVEDRSSIDKKVLELQKLSEVKTVSAYKQFIYVVPELGDVVFNPDTGFFDYDPQTRRSAAESISKKVDELNLIEDGYTVINTLDY